MYQYYSVEIHLEYFLYNTHGESTCSSVTSHRKCLLSTEGRTDFLFEDVSE